MLEVRKGGRSLRFPFSLVDLDGRRPRFCIWKLGESKELGTKGASQPIYATFIRSSGFVILTKQELFKLRRSEKAIWRLGLRNMTMTAIIKLLTQFSKTFASTCDVSFDGARISDITKDLVSCGFVRGVVKSSYRR